MLIYSLNADEYRYSVSFFFKFPKLLTMNFVYGISKVVHVNLGIFLYIRSNFKKEQLLVESLFLYHHKRNVFYFWCSSMWFTRCINLKIRKRYLNSSSNHGNQVGCSEPGSRQVKIRWYVKTLLTVILQLILHIGCDFKDWKTHLYTI